MSEEEVDGEAVLTSPYASNPRRLLICLKDGRFQFTTPQAAKNVDGPAGPLPPTDIGHNSQSQAAIDLLFPA
jgi:hypothetical protein